MFDNQELEYNFRAAAELERRYRTIANQDRYNWQKQGRPNQLPPSNDWSTWMVLAGRGFGKTRLGAEWVRAKIAEIDTPLRIALVGRTPADVRDVMINGESGLLNIYPEHQKPIYKPSLRKIIWPNGTEATTFSAKNPDQLRGPQYHYAWVDELATFPGSAAWDNLSFGVRLPNHKPQVLITTTPRPTELIKKLWNDPSVIKTTGSTYENKDNLAPSFLAEIEKHYKDTRLGRQEIYAEILDDIEGALWKIDLIDQYRVDEIPPLKYRVIGVDPAGSSNKTSDETGIIGVGLGVDGHAYVLSDNSLRGTPNQWASEAIRAYDYLEANEIVPEVNFGGELVTHTIKTIHRDRIIPIKPVRATKGKAIRAEPIVALYEQGKIHHIGIFKELENQLCSWDPINDTKSPDRLDALVWALTRIMIEKPVRSPSIRRLI
jgi:phage terminase large subunit-like protein